jgi:hypothetical protein
LTYGWLVFQALAEEQTSICTEKQRQPSFVEISGSDGMKKRFATGTKASFAVDRFNSVLKDPNLPVVCIAAVKEGEDPIEFGPDVELTLFDATWTLQIVQEGLLFLLLPGLHCLHLSFS